MIDERQEPCDACEGTGTTYDDDRGEMLADRCHRCDGSGWTAEGCEE